MGFDGYKEAKYHDSKISLLLEKHPPEYSEHLREWLCFCRTLITGLQLIEATALKSVAPMPEQNDYDAKIQTKTITVSEFVGMKDTIINYRDEVEYLKTWLQEIREAGEPFWETYKYCGLLDNEVIGCIINDRFEGLEQKRKNPLKGKHFRRLTEALREVKDDKAKIDRPSIVCLCGSTRFMDAFFDIGWSFTLDGWIVLSVGVCKHGPPDHVGEFLGPDVCKQLDELHKRKIDLCDEVFVLDVNGYIGDSTRSEIEYAQKTGKVIKYLSRELPDYKEPEANHGN